MIGASSSPGLEGLHMKFRSLVCVISLLSAAAVQAQQPPAASPEQQAARENAKKA